MTEILREDCVYQSADKFETGAPEGTGWLSPW